MATHSSTLAWRTPWTEEPGRLQFMGSQRVRYDHSIVIWSVSHVQFFVTPCHSHLSFTISGSLLKNLLVCVGEGDGGMIWENCVETCIISYKKRIASPGSIQDAWAGALG